jgi:hypothetical protein
MSLDAPIRHIHDWNQPTMPRRALSRRGGQVPSVRFELGAVYQTPDTGATSAMTGACPVWSR